MLYDEYKDMKTNEIADEVRRRIVEVIEKNTLSEKVNSTYKLKFHSED